MIRQEDVSAKVSSSHRYLSSG